MNIIIAAHLGRISQTIDIQADDLIHNGDLVKLVEQAWNAAGVVAHRLEFEYSVDVIPPVVTEAVKALNALDFDSNNDKDVQVVVVPPQATLH